jgi:catechol 2,3-dioxygenase-like lactoylglutathione lyase family enzyme
VRINLASVLVDDQDKALRFYTEVLGFKKKTEIPLGEYRWLTVVSAEDPDGVELVLEVEGTRMFMEGGDTVIGIPDSRTEIVMLRPPDGGTRLELSSFVRPDHEPGSPDAMANKLGLRNVAFEVEDLQAAIHRLAADGFGLVGGSSGVPGRYATWLAAGPAERHRRIPVLARASHSAAASAGLAKSRPAVGPALRVVAEVGAGVRRS